MGEATGQFLLFAVGVSLSPFAIVAVVLALGSPGGRVNGPAFVLGWAAGVAAAGAVLLLVSGGADLGETGDPGSRSSYLRLGLGILLLVIAWRQFRGRPRAGEEPESPAWMKSVDHLTPVRTVGLGLALSALNPKILIMVAGAVTAISQSGAGGITEAGALAVFVLLGTIGPLVPVGIFFLMRQQADELLGSIKDWMSRENATIMAVLCLVIGAKLIGDAISGLSA